MVSPNMKRALLAAALVVSAVALTLVLVWKPEPKAPVAPASDYKVLLIAVDGLDGYLTTQYAAAGRLPAVRRLLGRAATAQIAVDEPPVPLVGWTRLAMGRPLDEREAAAASADGGALFSLAPEIARAVRRAGGRTVTVGWPGTWPVREDEPNTVAPYMPPAAARAAALAPVIFGDAPGQASEGLGPLVSEAVSASRAGFPDVAAGVLGPDPASPDPAWDEAAAAARWALLADMTAVETAAKLIVREEPHLALVYLGGLNSACRGFLTAAPAQTGEAAQQGVERYAEAVARYHAFVDVAVDRLRSLSDERTFIVVCSVYGVRPPEPGDGSPTAPHVQVPPGVLIVHGRDATSTPVPLRMTTVDVAPTLLALLGVPIPDTMEGQVVGEALPPGFLQHCPPTYEEHAPRARAARAPDRETVERMNALVAARAAEMRVR